MPRNRIPLSYFLALSVALSSTPSLGDAASFKGCATDISLNPAITALNDRLERLESNIEYEEKMSADISKQISSFFWDSAGLSSLTATTPWSPVTLAKGASLLAVLKNAIPRGLWISSALLALGYTHTVAYESYLEGQLEEIRKGVEGMSASTDPSGLPRDIESQVSKFRDLHIRTGQIAYDAERKSEARLDNWWISLPTFGTFGVDAMKAVRANALAQKVLYQLEQNQWRGLLGELEARCKQAATAQAPSSAYTKPGPKPASAPTEQDAAGRSEAAKATTR